MADTFKKVQEIEEIPEGIVAKMVVASGIGSMMFRWNIDYTVGAGIISKNEKCVWTKDGLRTTCSYGGTTLIIEQSKTPDPLYSTLEHKYAARKG